MRVVVDVNHPAHVHLFKNFIWEMEKKGHDILVTASRKDVSIKLLDIYGIDHIYLGSYGHALINKIVNIPVLDLKMYNAVKQFKPDIFIGMSSIRVAHISRVMGIPSIALQDTEPGFYQGKILFAPFTDAILTPSCFRKHYGKNQIRYNGYHELAYLHPNYFKPNLAVLEELGLRESDTFFILRFVGWGSPHEVGHHGIRNKINLVHELEKYGHVLITSEVQLPAELERYRIKVSPEKLHDLLYYATLYVGEGGTTASEAATLGTHAIHISSTAKHCGLFDHLRNYGLMWTSDDENGILDLIRDLLQNDNLWELGKEKRDKLIASNLNVTDFIIWFVENYPLSLGTIKDNADRLGDRF